MTTRAAVALLILLATACSRPGTGPDAVGGGGPTAVDARAVAPTEIVRPETAVTEHPGAGGVATEAMATAGVAAEGVATDAVFAAFDGSSTPGCAVGVLEAGTVRYVAGHGAADIEAGEPITADAVFDIASVSKQITAGIAMDLVLGGELALDDPVDDWLPDLDLPPDITIDDLVHHTSGLPDYIDLLDAEYEDVTTAEDALDVLRGAQAEQVTGTYEYSNTGYFLLGQVIEAATGRSLAEVAEARAFGPLGMDDTRIRDDQGTLDPGQAVGYEGAGRTWEPVLSAWRQTGDGAVHTTVEDLLTWAALFLDPPREAGVGSAAWLDLMLSPGPLPDEDGARYGGGIGLYEVDGEPVLYHGGSWIGVSSSLQVQPADDLAVAVLCNIDDLDAEALGDAVIDVWVDEATKTGRRSTRPPDVTGVHSPPEIVGRDVAPRR